MEEIVRNLKDLYYLRNSGVLDRFTLDVVAGNIVYLIQIKEEIHLAICEHQQYSHHVKQDRSRDVQALTDYLLNEKVLEVVTGKDKNGDIKEVADLPADRCERMIDGV